MSTTLEKMSAERDHQILKKSKKKKRKERQEVTDTQHKEFRKLSPGQCNEINEIVNVDPPKEVERLRLTMELIHEKPDKVPPIVAYFPTRYDPNRSEDNGVPPPKVRVLRDTRRHGRLQVQVTPSGSNVEFIGTNYSGEGAYPQSCTYALGVLDKEAKTLKIAPIASNKIFRMEPKVRGLDISVPESPAAVDDEGTVVDRIKKLTYRFGTKKAINQTKKYEVLKRNEHPNAEKDLSMVMPVNVDPLLGTSIPSIRNIPPYNPSATTPEMVFPMENIIDKREWKYLSDVFELLEGGIEISSTDYPNFVSQRINKLNDLEDMDEKKKRAGMLSYITHLIKFRDQHSMDGASSSKSHTIPNNLFGKFSTMFGNSVNKWLSNEKNDLLISYILVLTLFVDDFKTELSDIAKDLRMIPVTLRRHYKNLGCRLDPQWVTLPVPLEFPKLRKNRNLKNRRR